MPSRVRVCCLALLVGFASVSEAADLKTRLAAKDIQRSEEIIAIAIQAGDVAELKAQARRLSQISGRIPDDEEIEIRATCGSSAGSLGNVASALSEPGQARLIAAARRDLKLFQETMPQCEADVGLSAPTGPSLRGK